MVDMDRRLRPVRLRVFAILGVGLLISVPWVGWWTLLPLAMATISFRLVDGSSSDMRRPEYALFAAWVLSEVVIGASVAIAVEAGGPGQMVSLSWLAIPIPTLVCRFSGRAVFAGVSLALGLVLAVGMGSDPSAVTENPPLVFSPAAVILCIAVFSVELMRSDREHRTRALVDPLTGVLNRHALPQRVEEISQRAAISASPVGVIVVDIDDFKQINQLHGHQAADRVLRGVVKRIAEHVRASDAIHRVGGDEILVLLPGTDLMEVQKIGAAMCQAVSSAPCEGVDVTISCGTSATTPGVPFDFQLQFDEADAALFSAKAHGRNCAESFSTPLPPAARRESGHAAPAAGGHP